MVTAQYPAKQSEKTRVFGISTAIIFTTMAVSQLVGFEKMANLLSIFWPSGLGGGSLLLAALVVTCEVFALPFLLAMRLSVLMRICSFLFGCLVILYCVAVTVNAFAHPDVSNGLLGSYITVTGGAMSLLFTLVTGFLFIGYVATLPRHQS